MKLVISKDSLMLVVHWPTRSLKHHTSKHDKHLDSADEIGHDSEVASKIFTFLNDKQIAASTLMIKGRFRMFVAYNETFPYLFVVSQSIKNLVEVSP